MKTNQERWTVELEIKPDFDISMDRIYAWYNQEIIDRVPIRFSAHNSEYNESINLPGHSILKNLSENDKNLLIRLTMKYPPVTRALLGAMLDQLQQTGLTQPLLKSLNPITKYQLPGAAKVLSVIEKWNIQ